MTPVFDRVHIELGARPHSPSLVRAMLRGVGEAEQLDPELLDDLNTAVSEACNNVVLHAYNGSVGPMTVDLRLHDGTIEVDVLDRGSGIHRLTPPTDDHMGVGLSVMAALADRAEFLDRAQGGTEVRLTFHDQRRASGPRGEILGAGERDSRDGEASGEGRWRLAGDVVMSLSGIALLRGVLDRVARGWAAIERFPLDRIEVVASVAETVSALAAAAGEGPVNVALTARSPLLELEIGPFASGSLDGNSADAIKVLADRTEELEVRSYDGIEILHLSVTGAPLRPDEESTPPAG
ncbi:MAG: ATP-binding protein [Solirubrobacteraceae bacterium]